MNHPEYEEQNETRYQIMEECLIEGEGSFLRLVLDVETFVKALKDVD